jgi:hypothetical protein
MRGGYPGDQVPGSTLKVRFDEGILFDQLLDGFCCFPVDLCTFVGALRYGNGSTGLQHKQQD